MLCAGLRFLRSPDKMPWQNNQSAISTICKLRSAGHVAFYQHGPFFQSCSLECAVRRSGETPRIFSYDGECAINKWKASAQWCSTFLPELGWGTHGRQGQDIDAAGGYHQTHLATRARWKRITNAQQTICENCE